MPTYLCHGFRWDRQAIRAFVAIHDLGDATADWVIERKSSWTILKQLHKLYPAIGEPDEPIDLQGKDALGNEINDKYAHPAPRWEPKDDLVLCNDWSAIKLLESDNGGVEETSRPYAFVANYVVRVDQDCNVDTEMAYKTMLAEKQGAKHEYLEKLQQELAPNETLAWHVVVCVDPERAAWDEAAAHAKDKGKKEDSVRETPVEAEEEQEERHSKRKQFWDRQKLQFMTLRGKTDKATRRQSK